MKTMCAMAFLAVATFLSCGAGANSFFPENDLGRYDSISANSSVDEALFNQIITAGVDSYAKAEAVQRSEVINVNRLWSNPTVNANVGRTKKYGGEVILNMYGGLARRKEITPTGFTIVLCHELGHAYGGLPYVQPLVELSAEGQADFYSTRRCLIRVWERVNTLQKLAAEYENYIENNCVPGDSMCRNGLEGAHGLANLLAFMGGDDYLPAFETPDPYETPKTILSYPKTPQCRLDTMKAGIFVDPRPRCWFMP